jgi:hypothetical protein
MSGRELQRYVQRVSDRWPVEHAWVSGPHEGNPAYVVIFVSSRFDGVPWLERVRQAGALWDATEMGGDADVHCYTPVELERKRTQLPAVRDAVAAGRDLCASQPSQQA